MASHIRYLLNYGGHMYAGPAVLQVLRELEMGSPLKTQAEVVATFTRLKAKNRHVSSLWIFREKRHINPKDSRYKMCCKIYGIGRPAKRLGWQGMDEVMPQPVQYVIGGLHGNQQPGLAPAPRRANRAVQAAPVALGGGQGNAGIEWQ